MDTINNNTQVVTKCAKKIVPADHTSSSSVNCWYKAGWSPAFTLSPDFDPKVQFWWDFAKCSLGFLLPADTRANQCGLLLHLLFCVPWLERVDIWVTVAFLSGQSSSVHSHLTSTKHFHPENRGSLGVFSFPHWLCGKIHSRSAVSPTGTNNHATFKVT